MERLDAVAAPDKTTKARNFELLGLVFLKSSKYSKHVSPPSILLSLFLNYPLQLEARVEKKFRI